jgi:hypothetical protein
VKPIDASGTILRGFFARQSAEVFESEAAINTSDPGQAFPVCLIFPNLTIVAARNRWQQGSRAAGQQGSRAAGQQGIGGITDAEKGIECSSIGFRMAEFSLLRHQSLAKRIGVHPCAIALLSMEQGPE